MTELEHLEAALHHVLVDLVTTVRESRILEVVVAIILVQKHYHPTRRESCPAVGLIHQGVA